MIQEQNSVSKPRASFAWLINALLLFAVIGIFGLALKETRGEFTLRTVLYGLLGVFGLLVNALLITYWLRGTAPPPDSGWAEATRSIRGIDTGEKMN